MPYLRSLYSQRVNITLPKGLLKQVDRLVEHEYGSRSLVIRTALLEFLDQPGNKLIADPDSVNTVKQYQELKAEYPYLDPTDAELIQSLYEYKIKKEREDRAAS